MDFKGASLVAPLVKNPPAMLESPVKFLFQEDPLERDMLPTTTFLGFPGGSDGKEYACNVGGLGLVPGVGKIPWKRAWQPTPLFLSGE